MADLRNELARARDDWMRSDAGRRCRGGSPEGCYLDNRIEAAFIAGWNARDAAPEDDAIDAAMSAGG